MPKINSHNLIFLFLICGLILMPNFSLAQSSPNLIVTNAVDKTIAKAGDTLSFTISYQNTGLGSATGTKVVTHFSQTYLEANAVEIYNTSGGVVVGEQITWDIGTFTANSSGSKTFKLKVKSSVNETVTLFNTAIISSNETGSIKSNTVEIKILGNSPIPNLIISDAVDKTEAKAGEILTFNFNYKNTGNGSATGTKVVTHFSQTYLEANAVEIYNTSGGVVVGEQITWDIGTFTANSSGSKTFKLKVKSSVNETVTLFNTAIISSNETGSIKSNTVEIKILGIPPVTPPPVTPPPIIFTPILNLDIVKTVKNLSQKDTDWHNEIQASFLDELEFKIEIVSNSNVQLENITIKDNLPSKILYQGDLKINGVSNSNNITSQEINIGNLDSGQLKTITFKAQIASKDNFDYGITDLINTVVAYNNKISKTDTCKIIVKKTEVAGATIEVNDEIVTGITDNLLLNSILLPIAIILFLIWAFKSKIFLKLK